MPDEEKVVAQAVQPETQPTAQTPDLASLTAERDTLKTELDKWQKEAKSHQSNFTKTQQELKRFQNIESRIGSLSDKLEVLGEYISAGKERDVEESDEKPKVNVVQKMGEVDKKRTQETFNKLAYQADREAYKAGLDINDAPELAEARKMFQRGLPDEGMEEVRRVVTNLNVKPIAEAKKLGEKQPEISEDEEEKIAKRYMEKKGLLKTDTGTPSSGGQSWSDVRAAYARGDLTTEQYSSERKRRGIT
uniref:Uncharacterized protein n=1 Tax=viral metagenome TaxID=1070528 RepID=A0A6M3KW19_9ZZZZ